MIDKERIAVDMDLGIQGESFRLGKVAMSMDGIWHSAGYEEQTDLNYGVASIPAFGEPDNQSFFSNSHNFVFPRNTAHKESDEKLADSLAFAKWMSDNSIIWGTEAGMLPARQDVVDSKAYRDYPLSETLLDQSEFAKYPPQISKNSELENIIMTALESVMSGNADMKAALDTAEKEVNKVLSE